MTTPEFESVPSVYTISDFAMHVVFQSRLLALIFILMGSQMTAFLWLRAPLSLLLPPVLQIDVDWGRVLNSTR